MKSTDLVQIDNKLSTDEVIHYLEEYKEVYDKYNQYNDKYDTFKYNRLTLKLYDKYTVKLQDNGFIVSYLDEYNIKEWIPLTDIIQIEKDTKSQFVGLSNKEYRFWFK